MAIRFAIITCSDTRDINSDTAGAALEALIAERGWECASRVVVADERNTISAAIVLAVDELKADVVLTCGGSGLSLRDVTPEATQDVCERNVPGIAEAMRAHSLAITPNAMLSRALCMQRGKTLVINLPGSEKAARENWEGIVGVLPHTVAMMAGCGHAFPQPQQQAQASPQLQPQPQPQLQLQLQLQPQPQPQSQPQLQPQFQAQFQQQFQQQPQRPHSYPQAPLYAQPQPLQPQPLQPQQSAPSKSMESLIGRNVIGVIAAILVFVGLVLLGVLAIPFMTDAIKIALMFVLSTLLTAGGLLLTVKKKNAFSTALLGCGCGSFFISILITHAYFHVFNDILAFALLLLWMAASFILIKLTDSLSVSILVHLGMVVSLCFAYYMGVDEDRILLLLIYQILAVVVITVGNIICYKKTYRLGLFVSLAFSLVFVCVLYGCYQDMLGWLDGVQRFMVFCAFDINVLGAAVLSYLLFASMKSLQDNQIRVMLHVLNKLMLIGVLAVVAQFFAMEVFRPLIASDIVQDRYVLQGSRAYAYAISAGFSFIFFLLHSALSIFLQKKTQSDTHLETISVTLFAAFTSTMLLFAHFAAVVPPAVLPLGVSGLILVALAMIIFYRLTAKPIYALFTLIIWGIDLLCMLFGGYKTLVEYGTVFAAVAYLALSAGVVIFLWRSQDEAKRLRTFTILKIALIFLLELSVFVIFDLASLGASYSLLLITILFLGMLVAKLDVGSRATRGYWIFIRVHEVLLVLLSSALLANLGYGSLLSTEQRVVGILLAVASIALLAWALFRVKQFDVKKYGWVACLQGLAFTLLVLGAIEGLVPGVVEPYVISLACMATALIGIGLGFVFRIKPLRIYGLVVIILCVLKLLIIDISYAESIMRVVAFIGGGLICFGISAFYTYAVKHLDK